MLVGNFYGNFDRWFWGSSMNGEKGNSGLRAPSNFRALVGLLLQESLLRLLSARIDVLRVSNAERARPARR